ncbi:MAG: cytidine deaminase [Bacilli bacterium]|nr:cytidine deaminase [Bacilli bacterium]
MLSLDEKYELAVLARSRSYSVYSKFAVGAVCILKSGEYVLGCNVENASYGLCNCAERTALFSLIANGYDPKDVVEMVIIADTTKPVSPCGACREVMKELLNEDVVVTLFNLNKDVKVLKVKDLLPYAFDEGDLNE